MVSKNIWKGRVLKYHDVSGHFAIEWTVAEIYEKYYFSVCGGMWEYTLISKKVSNNVYIFILVALNKIASFFSLLN